MSEEVAAGTSEYSRSTGLQRRSSMDLRAMATRQLSIKNEDQNTSAAFGDLSGTPGSGEIYGS